MTETLSAGDLCTRIMTVTDRDIVTAVVAEAIDPMPIRVEAVMTRGVVTASETDSVPDLLDKMRRKGLRCLPVATPAGVLVGLVTLDDLLTVMAEQLRAMALSIEAGQMRERKLRT